MVELVEFQVFPKDMGTRCFHALQPHVSHPKSHRLLQHSHLLHSGGIFSKVNDYTATQETSKTQLALSSLATYTSALLWQEALAVTTTQAWKLIKLIFLKRKTREKRNTHKSKGWWRGPTREWKLMWFFSGDQKKLSGGSFSSRKSMEIWNMGLLEPWFALKGSGLQLSSKIPRLAPCSTSLAADGMQPSPGKYGKLQHVAWLLADLVCLFWVVGKVE